MRKFTCGNCYKGIDPYKVLLGNIDCPRCNVRLDNASEIRRRTRKFVLLFAIGNTGAVSGSILFTGKPTDILGGTFFILSCAMASVSWVYVILSLRAHDTHSRGDAGIP